MLIQKVLINNIRSYLDEKIEFDKGVTLLSGNVGCGKTTLLLSIEFALFGIRKDFPAGNLLRNGSEEGYVELYFRVNSKEVMIKRVLKRNSKGVSQDSGYIIVDGVKSELTTMEMKHKVLELLNYPIEFLKKSKGLIYNYTVYTPQEKMKEIITGDSSLRQDTIRKIFGMDKYKRIQENLKIFLGKIREIRSRMSGIISDIDLKVNEKKDLEEKLVGLNVKIEEAMKDKFLIDNELEKIRNEINLIENKIKELNDLKNQKNLIINEKNNLESLKNSKINEKEKLKAEIEALSKDVSEQISEIDVGLKNKELEEKEKELNEINKKISEFSVLRSSSESVIKQINSLTQCPTCRQEVSEDYKKGVYERENLKIKEYSEKINANFLGKNKVNEEVELIKKEILRINENNRKFESYKLKVNLIGEKKFGLERIEKEVIEIELKINKFDVCSLDDKINAFSNLDSEYNSKKGELDVVLQKKSSFDVAFGGIEREIKDVKDLITRISSEIVFKEEVKKKMEYLVSFERWLSNDFIEMMSIMERNVLSMLHNDFNDFFRKWFSMIMGNEELLVRIDDGFAPVIEQSGHDIDYSALSGGERTACALSYRLALNQIINILSGEVNTKDLMILDEPTEGFSSEQVERLQGVLDGLDMKQIIIVSHESKIESFVDKVVRIEKRNGVSGVL